MKLKLLLLTIHTIINILIFIAIFQNGYSTLTNNYLWIGYSIFVVLTFPNLIAKAILKKRFFGFHSSLLYLIYPALFLVVFAISKITSQDLAILLRGIFTLTIVVWSYLVLHLILLSSDKEINRLVKKYIFAIPLIITIVSAFFLIRQPDSIVSLDYLQHQAVVNSMVSGERICIVPSQCSNLFLKDGYTTIYHFITSIFTTLSSNSTEKSFFLLDLVWWIVGSLIFYTLFSKYFSNKFSLLGTLLTSFIFINWAYEFNFFIPQTLAFLIFLNLINDLSKSKVKLIIGIILLVLVHFVMGTYLAAFLIIYYLFSENKNNPDKASNFWITLVAIATLALTLLMHIGKFSFETSFQADDIKAIGSSTNLVFPESTGVIINILGFSSIVFIAACVFYLFKRQKDSKINIFLAFIFVCLSTFFVGPTYASKFLIGIGLYSSMVIIYYLKTLKFERIILIGISLVLIGMYFVNFLINYRYYLQFYTRENGIISAYAQSDLGIINHLKDNNYNCIVISDPYSQLLVTGFTNYQTVNAQYMGIEERVALQEFISNPAMKEYRILKNTALSDKNSKLCFLYSSRLQTGYQENNSTWTTNIYQYITENKYPVKNPSLDKFFKDNDIEELYTDSYFKLYKAN